VDDCIFCRIVRGEAACHRVYEDEDVFVFLDIFPVSPGHTLVIPKAHARDLLDLAEESAEAIARVTRRIAHAIDEAIRPDGLMIMQLNRAAAGQTVFHYHTHLIPRTEGDSLALHTRVPGDPDALAEMAGRLAEVLGD
jgi:histidine triad (HIT) family protein